MQETLAEVADREATEVEAEVEGMSEEEVRRLAEDSSEPVEAVGGSGEDSEPEPTSEPGKQGSATVDDDEESEGLYQPPDPSQEELKLADELVSELRGPDKLGAEAAVAKLIRVVDVHPEFVTPMSWPGESSDRYRESSVVDRIATLLCHHCVKVEISARDLICLWRNSKSWNRRGRVVRADARSVPNIDQELLGAKAEVVVNYRLFRHQNPLQKVQTVYRALRVFDAEGSKRPYDFEGFLDELEVFGARTFEEGVRMERAFESAQEVKLPHQLSLLDGFEPEDGSEVEE